MKQLLEKIGASYELIVAICFRSTTVIAGFVIFLFSSYLYGPEGRGIISLLNSFYLAFSLILSLGLGRVVYQHVTRAKKDGYDALIAVVRYIYIASLIVICPLLMGYLIADKYLTYIAGIPFIYFLFFWGMFPYYLWFGFSNFLYSAVQKTRIQDKLIFFTRMIQVVILGVITVMKVHIGTFILTYSFSGLLIFLVETRILFSQIRIQSFPTFKNSLGLLKALLADLKWPYIDTIAQALHPSAIFLIGMYVSNESLGYYNFSLQILGTLYFPFSVMQIKFQEKIGAIEEAGAYLALRKTLAQSVTMGLILMCVGGLIGELIPHVGFSRFTPSLSLYRALLATIPLIGFLSILQGFWTGIHRPKISSGVNILIATVNIAVAWAVVERHGVWAGVMGIYFGYSAGVLLQLVFLSAFRDVRARG